MSSLRSPQHQRTKGNAQRAPPSDCGVDPQRHIQVARRAGQAEREERMKGFAFRPFALVTFIWALQMKVTRSPGRDPAGWQSGKAKPHGGRFKRIGRCN